MLLDGMFDAGAQLRWAYLQPALGNVRFEFCSDVCLLNDMQPQEQYSGHGLMNDEH